MIKKKLNTKKTPKKAMKFSKKFVDKNPIYIRQDITFGTDSSWVNALEITPNPAWVPPTSTAKYVWAQNDPNGTCAAVAKRFFITRNRNRIDFANLFLAVDNYAVVFINGRPVVIDTPQANTSFFSEGRDFDILRFLRRGRNDIVIVGCNFGGPRSTNNPAGILAKIDIEFL